VSVEIVAKSSESLTGEAWDRRVDELELALCDHPGALELEVEHEFTPGLYIRTLRAPADVLATTYIHRQTHPFIVTEGVVLVGTREGDLVEVRAPHRGITKVGTRRICRVIEPAVWTTFHPIPEELGQDIEKIEEYLFEFRTLDDGTNVRDRFRDALARKALQTQHRKEIEP